MTDTIASQSNNYLEKYNNENLKILNENFFETICIFQSEYFD